MELQQAQTYLLFRIHSMMKFFHTLAWLSIALAVVGFVLTFVRL